MGAGGPNLIGKQQILRMDGIVSGDAGQNDYHLWFDGGELYSDANLHVKGPTLDVHLYGAKGDGITDDTAAIQAAIEAGGNNCRLKFLPNKTYLVSTITHDKVNQIWEAYGATIKQKPSLNQALVTDSGGGLTLLGGTYDSGSQNGLSGVAFELGGINACVDVSFIATYAYGVHGSGKSQIVFLNCRFSNTSTLANATSIWIGGTYTDVGVHNCYFAQSQDSANVGSIYFTATSGVTVGNIRVTGCYFESPSGQSVTIQAPDGTTTIKNCLISGNNFKATGTHWNGGISLDTVEDSTVVGNTIDTNGQSLLSGNIAGIEIVQCTRVACVGNTIIGGTVLNIGISVNGSQQCAIGFNTINGFATSGSYGIGIYLYSASGTWVTNLNVISNNVIIFPAGAGSGTAGIAGTSNNVSAQVNYNQICHNQIYGNATTGTGIKLTNIAGAIGATLIEDNTLTGLSSGTKIDSSGDSTAIVRSNVGYNPVGPSAITVTASPFTYTAGASPETVYIYSGTVSNVSRGSTQIASASPTQVQLEPNQALTVTYTGAPTMVKDIH